MDRQDSDIRLDKEQVPPDVPDFDLIRPVGSGGFGQVWLATNRTTGKLRAVKVIPLHRAGQVDPAAREISSLTRLEANLRRQHPNLLHIDHVGKTALHLFYVMDPADDATGRPASDKSDYRPATLQSRLQDGPLAPGLCLDYARQLLGGLASLHAAGMVHRDVKPANCLFVDGQLKLADFGLLTEANPLVSRLGTQKYMPPDGRMDMRADVYAAGLVIYEIISGLPVDEFPRLGGQSHQVSTNLILTALLGVVLRACEREPEQRFADARAMLAELEKGDWRLVCEAADTDGHHAEHGRLVGQAPTRSAGWRQEAPVRVFLPGSFSLPSRRLLVAACVAAGLAAAGLGVWTFLPRGVEVGLVDVSFVTEPFEAEIYLDGNLLRDSQEKPYTTPCTVIGLPARTHRVAFKREGHPLWEDGPYDFARTQQIVSDLPE